MVENSLKAFVETRMAVGRMLMRTPNADPEFNLLLKRYRGLTRSIRRLVGKVPKSNIPAFPWPYTVPVPVFRVYRFSFPLPLANQLMLAEKAKNPDLQISNALLATTLNQYCHYLTDLSGAIHGRYYMQFKGNGVEVSYYFR